MASSYHHGDLKTQLINEGLSILDKEGYDKLSMRKVAQACGVSQTAPYRHFKDKDALVSAILNEALGKFDSALRAAAQSSSDPNLSLRRMGIAYVRFFAENPSYLRVMFLTDYSNDIGNLFCSPEDHLKSGHPFATFYEAVLRYKQLGSSSMQLNELLIYCWGLVHGIAVLIVSNSLPFSADAIAIAENTIMNRDFLK